MPFFDGARDRIHYRIWELDEPAAVVLFLHGGGEHAGQFGRLAARLNAVGVEVWAPDHLGHGLSGGARGLQAGLEPLTDDAVTLTGIIRDRRGGLPVVLGGFSLGTAVATRVLVRDESPYAGAFLVGAALPAEPPAPREPGSVTRLDLSWLGVDADYLEELEKDPLVQLALPIGPAPAGEADVVQLREAATKLALPVLFVHGTEDPLTSFDGVRQWSDMLPDSRVVPIPDGRHNVLNDVDYVTAIGAVREFVLGVTTGEPS